MEQPATIMVVDDEPVITRLVNKTMTRAGHKVIEINDSTSVMDSIKQQEPDIILLDINMPGLNGYEVLKQIRENFDIPVLMLTAVRDMNALVQSFDIGADDYIEKPFLPGILIARVQTKLRKKSR